MADVASTLRAWSTTAGNNAPSGSTALGSGLDDNLRELQAVTRKYLASKGSDMASGATVDLSTADGYFVDVTGTTTITSFGTEVSGISYLLRFTGALTLTHNATSLILPGAANITTANGDMCLMESLGSGNWQCAFYSRANGAPVGAFVDSSAVVVGSADATKKVRFEVDGLTTGTTRVVTVPDANLTLPTVAAQSDQETATSTTTYVSPGRQQFHPSSVKAEGYITAPTTVTRAYPASGVSVTNPGTGVYVVTHGVTFSGSTYSIAISAGNTLRTHRIDAQTATTFTVAFFDASGVAAAATTFSYICCGDLA